MPNRTFDVSSTGGSNRYHPFVLSPASGSNGAMSDTSVIKPASRIRRMEHLGSGGCRGSLAEGHYAYQRPGRGPRGVVAGTTGRLPAPQTARSTVHSRVRAERRRSPRSLEGLEHRAREMRQVGIARAHDEDGVAGPRLAHDPLTRGLVVARVAAVERGRQIVRQHAARDVLRDGPAGVKDLGVAEAILRT